MAEPSLSAHFVYAWVDITGLPLAYRVLTSAVDTCISSAAVGIITLGVRTTTHTLLLLKIARPAPTVRVIETLHTEELVGKTDPTTAVAVVVASNTLEAIGFAVPAQAMRILQTLNTNP